MNPGIHGAIAAAEARRRKLAEEQEEERMTRYPTEDLDADWEFKIIRSESPVFRKYDFLQQVLQEEAVSGWQMLEKLDDHRIRLKRRADAKRRDGMIPTGADPYRTQIGGRRRAIIALAGGLSLMLIVGIMALLRESGAPFVSGDETWFILGIIGLTMIVLLAAVVAKARS